MSENDETAYIQAVIDPDLKQQVRIAAARQDKTLSQVLRETLSDRFGDVEVPEVPADD